MPGVLAVDIEQSPLMWFAGYGKQPTPAIANGGYRTGDKVERRSMARSASSAATTT